VTQEQKPGVFISYGHDEFAIFALRLKQDLEQAGFQVWMDDEGIQHTHAWECSIEEGIKASRWAIACLTPHAMRRPDGVCLDELAVARFKGISIAPLMLRMVEPPLSICRIQWLDVRDCLTPINDDWTINEDTYQQQLKLLLATLHGEHELDHEGGQAMLRDALRPFDYGVEIDRHVPVFYGREWFFNAFDAWLEQPVGNRIPRVFWLQGDVGVGKTALAAMLAHKRAEVVGMHFCKASDSERSDPIRVLCSLAYQLSTQIPAYRDALLSSSEIQGISGQNSEAAFRTLFVEPMRAVPMQDGVRVLVIDALDEAMIQGRCELAAVLGGELIDQLPPWLRLVVTSRSDAELSRKLSRLEPVILAATDEQNRTDLRDFAHAEVEKRHPDLDESLYGDIARLLADKSEGSFLYLNMVFEEADRGRLDLRQPDAFPQGLTGLYSTFFERQFQDVEAYKKFQRPLLELLAAVSMPLPLSVAEIVLGWDDYDADDALEPLGALFPVSQDESGREVIEPFHRSILEWLSDRDLSGRSYRVSRKKGHERFVEVLSPVFESWQSSGESKVKVNDLFQILPASLAELKDDVRLQRVLSDLHAPEMMNNITLWRYWRAVAGDGAVDVASEAYLDVLQANDIQIANSAAGFLMFMGSYASAERIFKQVLKLQRAQLGEKHPYVANSLNNLALVLEKQGNYSEAEQLNRESLAMMKELLGDKHPGVAASMNNLATVLEKQGNYSEAEQLNRESLAMRKELLGDKHPVVAISLNNLAGVLEKQGNYSEAEQLNRESLAMMKELLGDKHPYVVNTLNNLALVLKKQGNYSEAEQLYREALTMGKELLGDKHPDVATNLSNLAGILFSLGNYSEAEKMSRESLAMRKELLGDKHPDVATNLSNLAGILISLGNYSEAEQLNRKSLAMKKELLGDKHPDVAISLNNLAVVLEKQGNYSEAEQLNRESLAMRKELLGDKHPGVAASMNNLATVLEKQGNYSEAEQLNRESLAMMKELLGDKHPAVATSLNNLAGVLEKQGNYIEAEQLYRKSLAMGKALLGDKHPDVAVMLARLAPVLVRLEKYTEAEPLLRELLEMKKELLCGEDADVASWLYGLAAVLYAQDKYSDAEPLLRESLETRKILFGDKHPAVVQSLKSLLSVLQAQDKDEEAGSMLAQVREMTGA